MRKVFLMFLAAAVAVVAGPAKGHRPKVDLGYVVHEAAFVDAGHFYAFEGIQYAEQPIGEYRFNKPVPPQGPGGKKTVHKSGLDDTKCIQAYPQWLLDTKLGSKEGHLPNKGTESCLVLDVHVPKSAMPANKPDSPTVRHPVVVWIHGGGFTYGHKKASNIPSKLLEQSGEDGGELIVVVSINYRLGLFGWKVGHGATPNLGLYDLQRALEWVDKYILLFGGDYSRVTLMGEGAGAASILHYITSKSAPQPQQAILQSPAFEVTPQHSHTREQLVSRSGQWLRDDGVNLTAPISPQSIAEEAGEDAEARLNQDIVRGAGFGKFGFGPIADGTFVRKPPQVLLAEGHFDKRMKVMASHYADKAAMFAPGHLNTAADVRGAVAKARPRATPAVLDAWFAHYPDVLDGTYPWHSQEERYKQMMYELDAGCSTAYLATAKRDKSFNAIFDWAPAILGEDVPHNAGKALVTVARSWVIQFIRSASPNGPASWFDFHPYGQDAAVMKVTSSTITGATDDMNSTRCAWVQKALAKGIL